VTSEFQEFIEQKLEALEFVEWDRFTHWREENGPEIVRVFGWIDREDQCKDFVHLEFRADVDGFELVFLGTSSEEYSKRINELLYDDGTHVDCRRVENQLDVENAVRLDE
jgi:hypothetical protein